jgi:hypothetical protein
MAKEKKKPSKRSEIAEHADIIKEAQKASQDRESRADNVINVTKKRKE